MQMNKDSAAQRYGNDLVEAAELFRSIAWMIDSNPDSIMNYASHPIITKLTEDKDSTCLQRAKLLEALAYGDAGVMLASPGPSLSGVLLRELGNDQQKNYFFDYVQKNKARTFLAVTEPAKGSDASNMKSSLVVDSHNPELYYLNGEKWLVGNGAVGTIGTLIARTANNPLGMIAVLLTPDLLKQLGVARHKLTSAGLAGVQLSYISFKNFKIPRANILGLEMKPVNRGMTALIKTFNRMRPCVGALAIGLAQAVLDYISIERKNLKIHEKLKLEELFCQLELCRIFLQKAANSCDQKPLESTGIVSIAKANATNLAESIVVKAFSFFGSGSYFDHPWLAKWHKDVFAFEYMEGTTDIQRRNIFKDFNGLLSFSKTRDVYAAK